MALPLPVPTVQQHTTRPIMDARSPLSPAQPSLYSPFSSIAMSPQYGNSCALTILKGNAEHPINAHEPIHPKHEGASALSPQSSRFQTSFSNLRSASQAASSGFDSSVNVHTVSDQGILLPFLDRPSEVKELLFDTKANESLMYRLCRVFGGDPERPIQRGTDERWDEMLELLTELDRPLLDDEDWLARLESLVMERSPALWAQLARCLGADGLTWRPAAQPSSSRFDSWALPSRCADANHNNDSPLSPPSTASSEDGEHAQDEHALAVSVEPLDQLPQSYCEQPAGKMHKSSLREAVSPATSPGFFAPQPSSNRSSDVGSGQPSPVETYGLSASGDESGTTGSLEDIMEEPGSSAQASQPAARRARSHSGKFAGLRISALSSSSPPASRRTSNASDSLSAASHRDVSNSPLPIGVMSPAGLAPSSPDVSPSRHTSTSFSKHRRLSTMIVQNNPAQQSQQQPDQANSDADDVASPRPATRRQRGVSEVGHALHRHSSDSHPRRRARSFARSFAELKSPTEHLEQLRTEHAGAEADRLADGTRRMSLQDAHNTVAASAPAVPTGGSGSTLLDPASVPPMSAKGRRASTGRKRMGSVGSRVSASSNGSPSPPIPGLLPDGRTRHPSGSCGSRDLSESIAAFRNTMGLSISPSPSEHDFPETGDAKSDAGQSSDSVSRKRKGLGDTERPQPTSRTGDTAEAKISRKGSPSQSDAQAAHFQQPKHMKELESRNKANGAGGSGLALGGGFSLAKSGTNFRRQSQDSVSASHLDWHSSFGGRDPVRGRGGGPFSSHRSPPPVQRRPGGFVSLAQEYERARNGRRTSESVYSINSNAIASSPSSSIASLDVGGGGGGESMARSHPRSSDESVPLLELSLARDGTEGGARKSAGLGTAEEIVKGDPTPKAGPGGGITPRASFVSSANRLGSGGREGYPFPNLLTRTSPPGEATETLAPVTPLSPLQACRTRLTPSPSAVTSSSSSSPSSHSSARSPSIVFPISPNPSVSRACEFQKAVDTPRCNSVFARISTITSPETASSIRELITTTERSHLPDENLLEQVAHRIGLVDHEHARKLGGSQAEHADVVLAEQGYEAKWNAFADLCRCLGVRDYELALARRRCGPAIDLSGSA